MTHFAPHSIATLKAELDLVEVIGHYVRLKKQGAGPRHVGLCPFHSEKTPSFGVHGALQYYKCFGCDAAGDVFTFVQQIESLTFSETLRLLAERYGIALSKADPSAQLRRNFTNSELITAGSFATALIWRSEKLLVDQKATMWEAFDAGAPLRDGAPLFSESIRQLTRFLLEVQGWTASQAAEALRDFRRSQPDLTAGLLGDVSDFQGVIAEFICALKPAIPRELAA